MSNVIRLDDHRPLPEVGKFDKDKFEERMSRTKLFKAEMKATGKIREQEQRLIALSQAWLKFQGRLKYDMV